MGERYTSNTYRQAIEHAVNSINARLNTEGKKERVSMWTPLQLRHSCATRLRKEYGLEAARVVLGHTQAATTEIYAEIDHDKASGIMALVG